MKKLDSIIKETEKISIEAQANLHNFLGDHLIGIGVFEPYDLTDDQLVILNDRIEQTRRGEAKSITLKECMRSLKKKYPKINLKISRKDLVPSKIIESVLVLSNDEKLALYKYLQTAADASFQEFLRSFNMTEGQWDKINEDAYTHFSAQYKREADAIRARNRDGE